jgi:hypothetical protein
VAGCFEHSNNELSSFVMFEEFLDQLRGSQLPNSDLLHGEGKVIPVLN